MKFKIGDRVKTKPNCYEEIGTIGTIKYFDGQYYAVEFDVYCDGGSCAGFCKDGYGWWLEENLLELLKENQNEQI